MTGGCECEHANHFDGAGVDHSAVSHPSHKYGDATVAAEVSTLYGKYRVCLACAKAIVEAGQGTA